MKLLIVRHGDPDYDIDSPYRKRLERGGVSFTEAFQIRCKKLSMYPPPWKSEGYCGSDLEKRWEEQLQSVNG